MPCTTILVGKKASHDGSTIIARNDDGGFEAKRLLAHSAREKASTYKTVISHLTVELPGNAMRYTDCPNVTKTNGVWPACGINEANVAMTATETITSNARVMGADPYVRYQKKKNRSAKEIPGGIGEEDLVTLVLPYIHSAREGVLRTGALLEQYGTYEPNGMAFADAYGEQKEHLCSQDLREFVEKHHLALDTGADFNPRLAFGSHSDADHIYNSPRAWFMARYFLPRTYKWEGDNADFTPESNDIPWSFVPEHKVTVEDVRYLLGSYYQGTPYNPYDKNAACKGKYRTIGVPNSDVCGIMQIRGTLPEAIQGVQWLSMGGSGFTACFPVYANVTEFPKYFSGTTETVSTDSMYWHSRLIAALTDAHFGNALLFDERYVNAVMNRGQQFLYEYDEKIQQGESPEILKEANKKIADMVKEESDKALAQILKNASEHMKIRYHRGDN